MKSGVGGWVFERTGPHFNSHLRRTPVSDLNSGLGSAASPVMIPQLP